MNRLLISFVCTVLLSVPALADELDLAQFLMVQQESATQFQLIANLPEDIDPAAAVSLPESCSLLNRSYTGNERAYRVVLNFTCSAPNAGLIQTRWGSDGAMLQLQLNDGTHTSMLLAGGPEGAVIRLPDWVAAGSAVTPGFWSTAWRYLELGTVHVLIGWDHLAFVLCLSLLASGLSLLWLISAFTLGHSISLALAHFGLLNLPIGPVEAIIALSVVFMAREALLMKRAQAGQPARSLNWRIGLTAGFGLIHGLGFASVLSGLGISATETVTALAFFNIGVEIGQILFVFAVLAVMFALRSIRIERQSVHALTCAVGAIGVFWTVERVIGL